MRSGFPLDLRERRDPFHRISLPARRTCRTLTRKTIPPKVFALVASPADWLRFSRFRGTVQQGPVRRQEWQIVQSQLDLRDFLP